jgi:hypothetical protein
MRPVRGPLRVDGLERRCHLGPVAGLAGVEHGDGAVGDGGELGRRRAWGRVGGNGQRRTNPSALEVNLSTLGS